MKISVVAMALLAVPLTFSSVHAALISGTMSFSQGGVTLLSGALASTTIPSAVPVEALQFIDSPPAVVSFFGTEGDYVSAIGSSVIFGTSPYIFTTASPLWSAGIFQFFSLSATAFESDGALRVYSDGYMRAAGYDDTPGTWVMTTQGTQPTVTWTSSVTTVPEPTTVALGLVTALGFVGWRRRTIPASVRSED